MDSRTSTSLPRVWSFTTALFIAAVFVSRAFTQRGEPGRAYAAGLIGLLAVGAALLLSGRELRRPGARSPRAHAALRAALTVGALLWFVAMIFPFL